ncbi:MAG: cysteine-rich repeat protein [Hyphomicrobiaceae bacterium]|jgi:cysteine-rich repeat protein
MLKPSFNAAKSTVAMIAAASLIGSAVPAEAFNPLTSRVKTISHVVKLATKAAKIRHRCANDLEKTDPPWTIDCSQDPLVLAGSGTGDEKVDAALLKVLGKASGGYLKLRKSGLPSAHGVSAACGTPTEDWSTIDTCLFQMANATSKQMLDMSFYSLERSVSTDERRCRLKLGRVVRSFYTKTLRIRSKCFSKNGLLGGGGMFADRFECLSTAIPPGLGRPQTGLTTTDNGIQKSRNVVRSSLRNSCPDNLEANGFPGNLTDPTGGIFGQPDLVQVVIRSLTLETQPLFDGIYNGQEHCGDGVVQAELGEECDDGDRDSCETDSNCDYNCTIQACGNAVACENIVTPSLSEECDDGNDTSNDGCTPECVYEYCGDGILQTGLDEQCDDGNQDSGDTCNAQCQFGFF